MTCVSIIAGSVRILSLILGSLPGTECIGKVAMHHKVANCNRCIDEVLAVCCTAGVIRPLSAFLRDWTENIYMAGQAGSGNVMYMYTVCVTDMSMAIIVMMTMAFMLSFVSAGKYWQ